MAEYQEGTTSKRARMATESSEEAEAEAERKKAQDQESSSALMDPLDVTEEIISHYHDFLEYMIPNLKGGEKDVKVQWERWANILKKGKELEATLMPKMKKVASEMERMKNDDSLQREFIFRCIHIPDLLTQLKDINSRLETSHDILIVSNIDFTDHALPSCLRELERAKEELSEALGVIKELKEVDPKLDSDDTDYEDEYMKAITSEMEP